MKIDQTLLSELICTRLSHDIIGNVGAVANAVELLEENDVEFLEDIRSILSLSSSVLTSRLKFFRNAFGLSNVNFGDISAVNDVIVNYLKTIGNANFPIEFAMRIQDQRFVKAAMLCTMIWADLLIRGGRIIIAQEEGNKLTAKITEQSKVADEKFKHVKEILSGSFENLSAQNAPVFYLQNIFNKISLADDYTLIVEVP